MCIAKCYILGLSFFRKEWYYFFGFLSILIGYNCLCVNPTVFLNEISQPPWQIETSIFPVQYILTHTVRFEWLIQTEIAFTWTNNTHSLPVFILSIEKNVLRSIKTNTKKKLYSCTKGTNKHFLRWVIGFLSKNNVKQQLLRTIPILGGKHFADKNYHTHLILGNKSTRWPLKNNVTEGVCQMV
jgi:hypothetical protein